jgi:hypothetical protein
MATASGSSIGRLVAMLEDAHRLQSVIRQNAHDRNLLDNDKKIYYMVDTSVFRIFAEPDRHSTLISAFPSLFRSDAAVAAELGDENREGTDFAEIGRISPPQPAVQTLFANALLTGEYIFRVAASCGGDRLLVSPEHLTEIYGYIVDLARRSVPRDLSPIDAAVGYTDLSRWLRTETTRLTQGEIEPAEWLDRVRRTMVSQLSNLGASSFVAEQRLSNVFSQNRIGHAAEALSFDVELISPPESIVEEWRRRIRTAKKSNRVLPNAFALDADAVTLAQLQLLNTDWRKKDRVCALITDDRGLHRACYAWRGEFIPKERPFFPLRDPRQFMPVLNIGEDTGGFTDDGVFLRIKKALDQLLTSFASTDHASGHEEEDDRGWPDMAQLASEIRRRASEGDRSLSASFAEIVRQQTDEVADAWLNLLEYSLVAKSDVILELVGAEREAWHAVLSANLGRQIGAQAKRVAEQFVRLTESSALLRLEVRAFAERLRPTSANRRMLVTDFNAFESDAFAGRSLSVIVDDLRTDLEAKVTGLQTANARERALVIGCICLGIGAWAAAHTLFGKADKESESRLDIEIRFFHCVSRRLAATHQNIVHEYRDVEKALNSFDEASSSPLQIARVRSEMLALLLCRCAYLAFDRKTITDDLQRAANYWRLFYEKFGARILGTQIQEAWRALFKQFVLNTFCALYWLYEAKLPEPEDMRATADRLFVMLEKTEFAFVRSGPHGEIYPDLARYALADGTDAKKVVARQIIDKIHLLLSEDFNAGFAIDIPFIDKIEFRYIVKLLTARHDIA